MGMNLRDTADLTIMWDILSPSFCCGRPWVVDDAAYQGSIGFNTAHQHLFDFESSFSPF